MFTTLVAGKKLREVAKKNIIVLLIIRENIPVLYLNQKRSLGMLFLSKLSTIQAQKRQNRRFLKIYHFFKIAIRRHVKIYV